MLLPGPGRSEGLVESTLGFPAENRICARSVSPDRRDVTGTATYIFIRQLEVVDCFKAGYQFENRHGRTGADIEDFIFFFHLVFCHTVDGGDMGFCEVDDVDVVAEAGAVGRIIVIAENAQALSYAGGGLGHIRKKVVGHAAGKLADESRRMGTDRIKVAEGDAIESCIGMAAVAQNVFSNLFGIAVRRCRRQW